MNSFNLDYDDEHQVPSQPTNPPYTTFSNQNNYAFSAMLSQDADLPLQNFARSQPSDLEGPRSNAMLTYDGIPTSGISMPMNTNATNAYSYDIPATYPAIMGLPPQMDHSQFQSAYPPFPQPMPLPQYSEPARPAPKERYDTSTDSTANFEDSDFSGRTSDWSQAQAPVQVQRAQRQPPERRLPVGQPYRPSQPVAIQPKKPVVTKEDFAPGLAKPDIGKTEHTGIYSTTGFDVLGALGRVAMRPNPKINIGAVDLSCAFVMCDILVEDHPIVYVSEAFERLTGYTKDEIVGRNCRFLQAPDGIINSGAKRTFVDGQTVYRLRSTIDDRNEIQASIINYRKGGQPFMNLITMIPIQWDSDVYRYYVGFQVDLVEKPDAVRGRNPDGNYTINYQRDHLPQYIVPPQDARSSRPDLVLRYGHDEVTNILNAMGAAGNDVNRHYLDRILVENTDDVIHVLSFNGEFLYLSPSCHKILEYDPAELIGKTLSAICHPSDIGPVIRDLRGSTTTAPVSVVYRIRQKHQGYMWFESHGAWHIDPNQGRRYLVMTGRPRPVYTLDQIARLGSSAALAENDIWAKISLSGVILFVTTKVKPVLGRSPDDLIGKGIQEIMEPETGGNATITQALEAACGGQGAGLSTVTGSDKETNEPPSFKHKIWHKKGHALSAHTTLYTGDTPKGIKPTFLVAQIRFARASPPSATAISAAEDNSLATLTGTARNTTLTVDNPTPPQQYGALGQRMPDLANLIGLNGLPSGNRSISPSTDPATFFTELNPTRGSSWQIELRELEKQNRTLADELQRLLARRRKRKRKQGANAIEKFCAMCNTKNTPEWRRGPSGNRDLCNSCGLRWAKQVRSQAQAQAAASSITVD
ncbi:transcriptional regulator family: GATA type zinc finger [Penicillium roqueforti]|uniref:PAS n=1 Tax=Penicillium roqueforti (strain FM164) TaxID=1365484 RepID=W6QDY1_PENRF|nr:transcriptional regulator family: GATA type zinc finger [Penicillium roqueforti]CDM32394.1 PAS [Penicillium roqueforti FM164]KAI2689431.1 transcriptional regulator family: GATA type zinc finger [Penicillium roqueforti]KAI2696988.1 transcriptional regulator family: GATA type zinc finger [Penicillium roqueforti]KAI2724641.1 transcriptional regulator family: GATA type zinc finger [Penicillium roqueforti]